MVSYLDYDPSTHFTMEFGGLLDSSLDWLISAGESGLSSVQKADLNKYTRLPIRGETSETSIRNCSVFIFTYFIPYLLVSFFS